MGKNRRWDEEGQAKIFIQWSRHQVSWDCSFLLAQLERLRTFWCQHSHSPSGCISKSFKVDGFEYIKGISGIKLKLFFLSCKVSHIIFHSRLPGTSHARHSVSYKKKYCASIRFKCVPLEPYFILRSHDCSVCFRPHALPLLSPCSPTTVQWNPQHRCTVQCTASQTPVTSEGLKCRL